MMLDYSDLLAQVDSSLEDIIGLEQALVQIPTVNTGFSAVLESCNTGATLKARAPDTRRTRREACRRARPR